MPATELSIRGALYHFGFNVDFVEGCIDDALAEPHRFFHTAEHIDDVVQRVIHQGTRRGFTERQLHRLILAAAFHDIVYDPKASDNEERSCELLKTLFKEHAAQPTDEAVADVNYVCQMIMATKTHEAFDEGEVEVLLDADMAVVAAPHSFADLLRYEEAIFREYQFLDYPGYAHYRAKLLATWAEKFPINRHGLLCLSQYVMNRRPRVGIYAGSFNPFHAGHMNIVQKAEGFLDKVIVAQGQNPAKALSLDPIGSVPALKYHQTEFFAGLLTSYVNEKAKYHDPVLVRGLRNGDDLAYEVNQLRVLQDLMPHVKTVFIHCDRQFEHISSTTVRQLDSLSPDLARKYRG